MGQSAVLDIAGVSNGDAVSSIPTEGRGLALVDPAREYHLTTLVVGDEAFVVHDDTTVSLAHRYYAVGDDTRVYEYETLDSVAFDDGELTLALRDGSTDSYTLEREPTDVLSALRTRLPAVEHRG
ncbi:MULTISPECIES: hypothetical protein [Haloferax]|uniref:hypothetical protein n=1 Tax=Haloferax TaxID=2251 RepID=UPI001CD949D8|nr:MULTISPECIES: hypothetical protein [Haloferax]